MAAKLSDTEREARKRFPALFAKSKRQAGARAAIAKPKKRRATNPDPNPVGVLRGTGYAVISSDSGKSAGIFPLLSDARAFAQAIADQTSHSLIVRAGTWSFTPDK